MKQWSDVERLQKEVLKQRQLILYLVEKMGGTIEIPLDYDLLDLEYSMEVNAYSFTLSSRKVENEQA
jgi:hypothetical protein